VELGGDVKGFAIGDRVTGECSVRCRARHVMCIRRRQWWRIRLLQVAESSNRYRDQMPGDVSRRVQIRIESNMDANGLIDHHSGALDRCGFAFFLCCDPS
jgi:hypothetical protein